MKNILSEKIQNWMDSFQKFDIDTPQVIEETEYLSAVRQFEEMMKNNYPFHHPLYVGQMSKQPHQQK